MKPFAVLAVIVAFVWVVWAVLVMGGLEDVAPADYEPGAIWTSGHE